MIKVKNQGEQAITSLEFKYGVRGGESKTMIWQGQIPSMTSEIIELERFDNWGSNPKYFDVEIVKVNGNADEYALNNKAWSEVSGIPPVLPDRLYIVHNANQAAQENSFKILDANNHVIYERGAYQPGKLQIDTIQLYNSCFTFYFSDEGEAVAGNRLNQDGINWWGSSQYDGTGSLQIRNGYNNTVIRSFNGDFGSFIKYTFTVGYALNTAEKNEKLVLSVWPNPASSKIFIDFGSNLLEPVQWRLYNLSGSVVLDRSFHSGSAAVQEVEMGELPSGIYLWKSSNGGSGKLVVLENAQ